MINFNLTSITSIITHTRARTYTHSLTHSHAHMHTCTHAYMHTLARSLTHSPTHSLTHSLTPTEANPAMSGVRVFDCCIDTEGLVVRVSDHRTYKQPVS